jgi:uncharacterized protein YjbJ (UPF0337 family)
MSSSAWNQKGFSISSTGVPLVMVFNEDQFKGKWKQFKGELKNVGVISLTTTSYIEGRSDKFEGKLQERYGDRKDEVKNGSMTGLKNKTTNNMKP